MRGLVVIWLCVLVAGGLSHATAEEVYPALNQDPEGAPVGARPYELNWAGRHEPAHPQLVDFEELEGWRTHCFNGAKATLMRSQQELIYGEYTARVEYLGETAASRFVIEPPEPIAIPVDFTAVNLWVRGNTWSFMPVQSNAMVGINVLVEDAVGRGFRIPMDPNNHDYWFLSHRTCVSPKGDSIAYEAMDGNDGRIVHPAKFTGIEVIGVSNRKIERLHFDALQFYIIEYPPLEFDPIPEELPWPTTPDTILPSLKTPVSIEVEMTKMQFRWQVSGDEDIRFEYTPKTGLLSDLQVSAGGQAFYPCWGGGITFELAGATVRPGDEGVTTALAEFVVAPGGCRAVWELAYQGEKVRYGYRFEVKNKSMLIEVNAEGRAATRLDIGGAKGLAGPKLAYFPYLTYGDDWPKTVCSEGPEGPVFLWAACDYYNSDASELFGAPMLRLPDTTLYTGGSLYIPTTAGLRNSLRDRIFVNISKDVQETLPDIPNPDSTTLQIAREYLWQNIGHAHQNESLSRYKAYGIDKFIACHHEVGWREGGESFTLRDKPADSIGADRLAEYSAFVRGLGYRFGTYTNYTDFAPVNANWDEDAVCLNPDGTWKRAWPRCYTLKPLRAAEFEAYYAPRINALYGTNAQYCDVHTAFKPWTHTDYDARTPGAGMFKMQFNAYARLLYNESFAHQGPVFSEGNYHWFYAGIVDGNYATILPYGDGWKIEPLVDFDLMKMHTKMTDFGMGFGEMYYGLNSTWWRAEASRHNPWFDRFTAATVAFGHIGFLTYEWGFEATLKGYYQLQALQQRYATVPVREIRYHDGEGLLDTSAAILSDAYKRRHIFVEYENGLRVWVNLSRSLDWPIERDGIQYLLPPTGYLAARPGDILTYSAVLDGHRHELVECADYLYLDSRDAFVRTGTLAASGAVAVKPESGTAWEIIPATRADEVSIHRAWLGQDARMHFGAEALNEAGDVIGNAEVRIGGDWITVMPLDREDLVKYRLSVIDKKDAVWSITGLPEKALPGETIEALLEIAPGLPPLGNTIEIEMPGEDGAFISLGSFACFEAEEKRTAPVRVAIPDTSPTGQRSWFRCTMAGAETPFWFETLILPKVDIKIEPGKQAVPAGEALPLDTLLTNNLPQPYDFALALSFGDEIRLDRTIRLEPGQAKTVRWELPHPEVPYAQPVLLRAGWPGGHLSKSRYLRTTPDDGILIDLLHESYVPGQCLRGEEEMPYDHPGTMAFITPSRETLDNEALDGLHIHPPYANDRVGYTFVVWEVELPEGKPAFDFALGFRRGSTTRDGCIFKVTVIDKEGETEVFSEHYQTVDAWAKRSVDLSAYAGQDVSIKLITDVGPNDDSYSDWALWGAPRIVTATPMARIKLFDDAPRDIYAPPPHKLTGLRAEDLKRVKSAHISLESAGVDAATHPSFLLFNGIRIGTLPPSAGDLSWTPGEVPLTPQALASLGPMNTAFIQNPNQDYMKVRQLCLHFELDDDRKSSSYVALGPYTSAIGWLHQEGEAVSVGENLPTVRLDIPLSAEDK